MIIKVDIRNMDSGCYNQSVKKEIIAIHDQYLETGDRTRELRLQKKKVNIIRHLFLLAKVFRNKTKLQK